MALPTAGVRRRGGLAGCGTPRCRGPDGGYGGESRVRPYCVLTVWSSSSSSAGSGMPSSPRYRERASKESSSFENAGLERKGVSCMEVSLDRGHGGAVEGIPVCSTTTF